MPDCPESDDATMICNGCATPTGTDGPQPSMCGHCPPRLCDQCGEMESIAAPCSCWVSLAGMPLADVKGLLALGDLSVGPPSAVTSVNACPDSDDGEHCSDFPDGYPCCACGSTRPD